jgi:hypothetical protein
MSACFIKIGCKIFACFLQDFINPLDNSSSHDAKIICLKIQTI